MPIRSNTYDSVQSTSQLDDPVPEAIPAIPTSVSSKSIDEFSCCCCRVPRSGDSLKNIKQQILMRNILTQVVEEIQNLRIVQPTNIHEETHQFIFVMFNFLPINSDEHIILVEEYLQNEKNFRATVDEFSKLGGNNLYDFTKRCLNVVMSNSFASEFSWHGAKKKRIFKNLELAKMLLDASQSKLSDNQKATEQAIKKWLRRPKERSKKVKVPNDNNNNN